MVLKLGNNFFILYHQHTYAMIAEPNTEILMYKLVKVALICSIPSFPVYAGGWETGRLDAGFTYELGNYAEVSYGELDYSISGEIDSGVSHQMAKDQTRSVASAKFQIGKLHVGFTSFDSGAIQMDGQSAAADRNACFTNAASAGAATTVAAQLTAIGQMRVNCSLVPSADIKFTTNAVLGRYELDENFSVLGGVRHVTLASSSVSTLKTDYKVDSASQSGLIYGFSYQIPSIALKAEIISASALNMDITGNANGGLAQAALAFSDSKVGVPETLTFKFQTGIAENTLLLASAHHAKWKTSQIVVDVTGTALDVSSDFKNTTAYSVGFGRRINDSTSASLSYSWEDGSGSTSTSPFTMSNGSKTISVGVQYQKDAFKFSTGLSYTEVGDVTASSGGLNAIYKGNNVTSIGLKIGYNF